MDHTHCLVLQKLLYLSFLYCIYEATFCASGRENHALAVFQKSILIYYTCSQILSMHVSSSHFLVENTGRIKLLEVDLLPVALCGRTKPYMYLFLLKIILTFFSEMKSLWFDIVVPCMRFLTKQLQNSFCKGL